MGRCSRSRRGHSGSRSGAWQIIEHFAARCRSGAWRTIEQFDRTHRGARRVEAVGDQHPAIGQHALRVPCAVANHRRASPELTAADDKEVGCGSGITHGIRAIGDQQFINAEARDTAVITEPARACRAKVGPSVRQRVVAQQRIRRREPR
jgi:hypothetical protein